MHLGIKNLIGSVKKYLFGDGQYSQNIVQGGAVLQPQANYTAVLGNIAATGTFSYTGNVYGSYTPSNIFNGNISDWGILDATPNNSFNWDFGRSVEMQKVRILLYRGASNAHNIIAEYSDNGVAWSTAANIGYVAQDAVFHDYALGSAVGAHRYWRLRNTAAVPFEISEMQWIEQVQLQNCIVITGAATVAPDATTGAAAFSCQNIVIDGGTLAPSTNCKGLVGFVSGSARCVNGGRIHIDKLGKAGNFGNLTVLDLVPQSLKGKLKPSLAACVVLGEGAAGGRGSTPGSLYPLSGSAAAALQTGGGGGGGSWHQWGPGGNGGKGGPCCGGAGGPGGDGPYSTTRHSSGDYGGPAGQPVQTGNYTSGGAPADPPGTTVVGSVACGNPTGAGGGLLMLFSPSVSLASGCIISADGAAGVGVSGNCSGSGGAGGGCVVIGTLSGGYTNLGTVRASGGDRGLGYSSDYYGSYGGAGSVNTFTVS